MIFNFTKEDFRKTNELLKVKERNILAAEFYIEYLNDYSRLTNSDDITNVLIKNIAIENAFYETMLQKMNINKNDKEFKLISKNSHLEKVNLLNTKDYENNPYYQLIKNLNLKDDNWIINNQYYEAYEGFVYDEIKVDPTNYSEYTPIGFFNEKFIYPAIIEDDLIWMSIIPHEINTMKEAINNAYGNVLVIGLGLGYFAFMVSKKENVKSVTIIEKDQKVINMFTQNLLPIFKNKNKIKIIHDDAFVYLNSGFHYDYLFFDIYHNVGDGFSLYLKAKNYENKQVANLYDYWIETSLIAMLRRYVLMLFEEKVIYHYTENDYKIEKNENDKIINKLYFHLRDYQFNSYQEFHDFLSDTNLKKLARELKYQ